MAHDSNGRIYVDTQNGVGIGIQEVNAVLGAGSLDLGTLCRATSLINGYAKKKPLAAGNVGGYTEAQAKAINYGLYIPYYTTFGDMVRAIRTGDWSGATGYIASRTPWTNKGITAADWARLLDFNGYQHNAPQPVAQVFARNTVVGLGFTPDFEADLATYNAEYITLSDIGFTASGTDYRGSNMYVGLVTCDGTDDPSTIFITHNFWKVSSNTATGLNSLVERYLRFDDSFAFDRGKIPPTYNAPTCLFLSSRPASQLNPSDASSLNVTGVFIPVIPTRAVIGLEFVVPSIAPMSQNEEIVDYGWWNNNGDVTLIVKCFPNGNFTGKFDFTMQDRSGSTYWAVSEAQMELSLYKVMDIIDDEEVQFPVYIKFVTGTDSNSRRIVTATSYTVPPSVGFYDIYYDDGTLYPPTGGPDTVELTAGVIPSQQGVATIAGDLGNSSDGWVTMPSFDVYNYRI